MNETPPITLTDWLRASRDARDRALPAAVDRLRALDVDLHAMVQVAPQAPTGDGPLHGIPFASKDIIDIGGLVTEYGSPLYAGRLGTADAAIVAGLRAHGAVVVGNARCAAFAFRTPPPTENPRARGRTPGGSSSGSAAAVAAGLVPFSLGTQTLGSILRPASFCGVTGFKPTFGVIPTGGVLPFARSLDTVGFFTHTPADMLALWEAIGQPAGRDEPVVVGAPDPMPAADAEMAAAVARALEALARAGFTIRTIDLAPLLETLLEAATVVMFYEGAREHRERYDRHGAQLKELADLVREGLQIPDARYEEALAAIARGRAELSALYETTPVIAVPAAPGLAPLGLASTGDARMNAPWTALGTPAISIPLPVSGPPLGLQLTADRGADARLLRAAIAIHRSL